MRKEKIFTVQDDGRDKGKVFFIREMACERAEKWALRALSAAARAGVDVGNVPTGGMAAIAVLGIEALLKVSFDETEPLLDELFSCVKIIRDTRHPEMSFALVEDDVEEVQTRLRLRMEVLQLHVDFLSIGDTSNSTTEKPSKEGVSQNIRTSRHSSGPRSRTRITR